ncbi:MAG: hemerythrin domain-containing protein [Segetibacter sp.]
MSKATPIKRDRNLVWLSRDHHDGLLMVWKIRQGIRFNVSNTRINNFAASAFRSELEPHFYEEEDLLFINLPESDALRVKAESEHAAIREIAAALKPGTESTDADLEAFANLLEAHIRFEERILFPYIEKEISAEMLDIIGSQLEAEHLTKKPFVWQDEFWIKGTPNH